MSARRKPAGRRKKPPAAESGRASEPLPPPGGSHRVVILSRNAALYSTHRLVEAAEARGHRPRVVDTLACSIVVDAGRPTVMYEGAELGDVDVVIPRIGASVTRYGLAVVNQFDMMRVPVVNNSVPIARSRDKLRCLQLLARFGISVPRTAMARGGADVKDLVRRVGGLPAIVKLTHGTQGVGVMIAHSMAEISSILDTMWDLGQEIILQEFIEESKGRDVRVFVVGDRAVGAMRRRARRGEFRSNLHRGGEGQAIELPPEYARIAVEAARVIGLDVAGVDLLEANDGPKVMEVNSSPGLEGIERSTGEDIAGMIVDHAVRLSEAVRAGWRKPRLI